MKKITTHLTILFLLLMISSCGCWDGIMPNDALCTKDAQTLEQNYIMSKGGHINADKDIRIVEYKFESLQHYFCYVDAELERLRYNKENAGIRVYFGKKKENRPLKGELEEMRSVPGEYFTSVFFVPTIDTEGLGEPDDFKIIYEIAAYNYGSSRKPPYSLYSYSPDPQQCPLIDVVTGHAH